MALESADGVYDDSFINVHPIIHEVLKQANIPGYTSEWGDCLEYCYQVVDEAEGFIRNRDLVKMARAFNSGHISGFYKAVIDFHRLMGFKTDRVTQAYLDYGCYAEAIWEQFIKEHVIKAANKTKELSVVFATIVLVYIIQWGGQII